MNIESETSVRPEKCGSELSHLDTVAILKNSLTKF